MAGSFDDLMPNNSNSSGSGTFDDLIPKTPLQKPENILQRATKAFIQPAAQSVGNIAGGIQSRNPWQILKGVATGGSTAGYEGAMDAKNVLLEPLLKSNESMPELFPGSNKAENFITKNIATDPMGYMGAEGGVKLASAGAKGVMKLGEAGSDFFSGLKNRAAVKSGTTIQQGVRKTILDKFLGRTKEFDEGLSKLPEATHDITDNMNRLKKMSEVNPSIREAIDQSPIAKKLLYGSETGVSKIVNKFGEPMAEEIADQSNKVVDTKTLQNLRNQLGKNFDYGSAEHDWTLGRELGELRLKQAEPFPKEMGELSKGYKDTLTHYGNVKSYLNPKRLGSAILKGFGGEGGAETRESLDYFLGNQGKKVGNIYKSGQTMEKIKDLNPFSKMVKFKG